MGKVIIEQNDFDLSLGGSGSGGSSAVLEPLTITSNGTYLPSVGADGFNTVTANVQPKLENIEPPQITENGKYVIRTSNQNKYDGMRTALVDVNVKTPAEEKSVKYTKNGIYDVVPTGNNLLSKVNVTVDVPSPIILAEGKTVNITENCTLIVSPTAPNKYLTSVIINTDVGAIENVAKALNGYLQAGGKFGNSTFTDWPYVNNKAVFTNITDLSYLFYNTGLTSALTDWFYFDSTTTNMSYMFGNCKNLTKVMLPATVLPNSVKYMFDSCAKIGSITIPENFTSLINDMSYWFRNCTGLEEIDLTSSTDEDIRNFSTAESFTGMFVGCSNLKSVIGTYKYDDIETYVRTPDGKVLRSTGLVALKDIGKNYLINTVAPKKPVLPFIVDWTGLTKNLRYSSILALIYGLPDVLGATEMSLGIIRYSGDFLTELYDDDDKKMENTEYSAKIARINQLIENLGYTLTKIDK